MHVDRLGCQIREPSINCRSNKFHIRFGNHDRWPHMSNVAENAFTADQYAFMSIKINELLGFCAGGPQRVLVCYQF